MHQSDIKNQRGFTLVEIITVISIITILFSIVLFSISQARQNSRDRVRVGDLAQIEFALVLYREKNNNTYPIGSDMVLNADSELYADLQPYLQNPLADPLSGSTGHDYVFDSNFICTDAGIGQVVIYAQNVEQTKNANFEDVCPEGSQTYTNSYVVVLD